MSLRLYITRGVIREIKEESAEVKGFEALIQQRFDEDVINEWKKFKWAVLHDYMPSSKEEANKLLTYSFAKEKIWGGGGEIPRASKVKDKEYMFKMDSGLCRLCGHYVLRQTIASEINNLKAKYSTLTKEKIYRCKPVGKKLFLMLGSYYFGTDIRAYNHVKEHFDYDKAEEILFKRLDFRYELFQRFIQSKYLYDYTAYQGLGKQFQDMGDTFQSFIRNQKFSLEQLGSTRIKIMTEEEEQNREIQIDKYNARISYVGYFIIGELLASDTVHEAMGREDLSDVGQELYKNVVYNSSLDSGSAQDPNYFIVQEALSSKSSKAKKEYSLVWYDTEIR